MIYKPSRAGGRTRFLKLKRGLFGLGSSAGGGGRFSDPEKTILVYFSRYRGLPREGIISTIGEYGKHFERRKLQAYLKFYPKTVGGSSEMPDLSEFVSFVAKKYDKWKLLQLWFRTTMEK
jgi:hypothetical protein